MSAITDKKEVQKSNLNREAGWHCVGSADLFPPDGGLAVKIGEKQIAVFNFTSRGEWYASDNLCPHKKYQVLARGILGDLKGEPKVVCPMHKRNFLLRTGANPEDPVCRVSVYPVKIEDGQVFVKV